MKGRFYLFILLATLVGSHSALGQGPVPTPTPPAASDKQNVKPKDLKGVPEIAPAYRSDDRGLPDLGRVGIDMTRQKTLTLREAIELALDNNRDIEISRKTARIS